MPLDNCVCLPSPCFMCKCVIIALCAVDVWEKKMLRKSEMSERSAQDFVSLVLVYWMTAAETHNSLFLISPKKKI